MAWAVCVLLLTLAAISANGGSTVIWPSWANGKDLCWSGDTGERVPCPTPPPPPKDAEGIASRTRIAVAAYEREEADKAAAFYTDKILPLLDAHLAGLPDRLRAGNVDALSAHELTVAWPVGTSKAMRKAVVDLLQRQGFDTEANENLLLVKWPH